jgi:phosphodiesterase/alkaline phosphatase D-like protein
MTKITRRGLLGAAATGTLSVAACATTATNVAPKPAPYAGEVEFLHGVASGDPLSDRVIIWTRATPRPALARSLSPTALPIPKIPPPHLSPAQLWQVHREIIA